MAAFLPAPTSLPTRASAAARPRAAAPSMIASKPRPTSLSVSVSAIATPRTSSPRELLHKPTAPAGHADQSRFDEELESARTLLRKGGRYEDVVEMCRRAEAMVMDGPFVGGEGVAVEESVSELYRQWAHAEASFMRFDEARGLYRKAIKAAPPPDAEAKAWSAWALFEQRQANVETARKCFLYGFKASPNHVPLLQSFGTYEAKFGSKDNARKLFSRATCVDKTSERPWIAWANFEANELNQNRARFLYSCAVRVAATRVEEKYRGDALFHAYSTWAKFEERNRNHKKAKALYAALNADCHTSKTLQCLAVSEARRGSRVRAEHLFREAIQLAIDHNEGPHRRAPIFQAWALMEKNAHNYEKARVLFEKGAECDPRHAYIWQSWGLMEVHLKNFGTARKLFEIGAKANPASAPIFHAWARMEAQIKHIDTAAELYAKAVQADPCHVMSYQSWAILEKNRGDLKLARELFAKAVDCDPKSAQSFQAWAIMEFGEGNEKKARELFKSAMEAQPDHVPVWHAWAEFEKKTGAVAGPFCSIPEVSK